MINTPIFQVDAFTSTPFSGNPAAVCLLSAPADPAWMQLVAREMNLSETAFLLKQEDGYSLRWFTPAVEVDLCGHATLASAHVLWETGLLGPQEQARFHTRSGLLTAERRGDLIVRDFPATPDRPAETPPGLCEALGVTPLYVGKSRFDYLIQVESEELVRNLKPDLARLKTLPVRGIIVTALSVSLRADEQPKVGGGEAISKRCFSSPGIASDADDKEHRPHPRNDRSGDDRLGDGQYDFVSRFFAPAAGVDEDPVTGSAHCCLGPFWQRTLGKDEFVAYQASPRGGTVHVRVAGERVRLGGQAVTVLRGELLKE